MGAYTVRSLSIEFIQFVRSTATARGLLYCRWGSRSTQKWTTLFHVNPLGVNSTSWSYYNWTLLEWTQHHGLIITEPSWSESSRTLLEWTQHHGLTRLPVMVKPWWAFEYYKRWHLFLASSLPGQASSGGSFWYFSPYVKKDKTAIENIHKLACQISTKQ